MTKQLTHKRVDMWQLEISPASNWLWPCVTATPPWHCQTPPHTPDSTSTAAPPWWTHRQSTRGAATGPRAAATNHSTTFRARLPPIQCSWISTPPSVAADVVVNTKQSHTHHTPHLWLYERIFRLWTFFSQRQQILFKKFQIIISYS